jgi:hypothetical protein
MQRIRRLAAIAGVTALAAAFVAGPANADTAEVYVGSAAARGFHVSVVSPVDGSVAAATLGAASASVDSTIKASSQGAGQITPALPATVRSATATKGSPAVGSDKACALAEDLGAVEQLKGIIDLGLACGDATATTANDLPVATAEGSVVGLTVDGQTALTKLTDALPVDIGDTLSGVLGTVCDTLKEACPATTTVQDLVTSILKTRTLDVSVGKSTSSAVTDAAKITSTASASGATVKILPLPQVNGLPSTEPLATIEISSAKATAVYDRAAGKTLTPTFDPAIARVKFNTVLTQTLGLNEFVVPVGAQTILKGMPFESDIIVGAGQVVHNNDGTDGAVADGVKLHLFKPLGESSPGALDGGITIELAHAEAGVAGQAPTHTTVTVPDLPRGGDVPVAKELPRTGGTPWIPFAGVGVLAIAVLFRRASLRANAS